MRQPGRWLRDAADWLPAGAWRTRGAAAREGGTPAGARGGRHTAPLGERPVVRVGYSRVPSSHVSRGAGCPRT